MLDVAEKESVEETALRFGCKYHLSGLVVSQVCTDISKRNCNTHAQKKVKKKKSVRKSFYSSQHVKNYESLTKKLSYADEYAVIEVGRQTRSGSRDLQADPDDVQISRLPDRMAMWYLVDERRCSSNIFSLQITPRQTTWQPCSPHCN